MLDYGIFYEFIAATLWYAKTSAIVRLADVEIV
jgi:hypothetical protein